MEGTKADAAAYPALPLPSPIIQLGRFFRQPRMRPSPKGLPKLCRDSHPGQANRPLQRGYQSVQAGKQNGRSMTARALQTNHRRPDDCNA